MRKRTYSGVQGSHRRVVEAARRLPSAPGVYLMKDARGRVLYIGKAANLRRRAASYFIGAHDARITRLIREVRRIDHRKTDTALEALILEAALIKRLAPPFNVREKDDKSFLYVQITKERFPRVLLARGRELEEGGAAKGRHFGPFTSASSIREALRIVRRIFPWSTHASGQMANGGSTVSSSLSLRAEGLSGSPSKDKWPMGRPCFDYQIGLCPGTCVGAISRKNYLKNIRNIAFLFAGKKQKILAMLKKEMREASRKLAFEQAAKLRKQIFALRHIQDVALIGDGIADGILNPRSYSLNPRFRIEGYDISNISGTSAVGSMVVFVHGAPAKSEYRKFKIRTIAGSDDVGMLTEVLRRRFRHTPSAGGRSGWPLPGLILVDGGKPQVNAARRVLNEAGLRIPVVGLAKGPERKRNDVVGTVSPGITLQTLIRVRDEAHRFAVAYHKKVRGRGFLKHIS